MLRARICSSFVWRQLQIASIFLLLFAGFGCAAPSSPSIPSATIAPAAVPQPPAPTSAPQPKRGGTYTHVGYTADPPDLDPYLNVSFSSQTFAGFYYSRLLKFDNGPGIAANAFIPTGDLAEKWDISKDGLTYTFSLRKNAKWQNKPPMNGRPVTADDVVWSYKRFIQVSPQKGIFSGVKDVKAIDVNTVAFTLNEIFAPFENTIAQPIFWIMPREVVEQDGDARKRVVGSGPWMFEKFDKGVQIISKRNPDYYITGQPYLDEIDSLIIPDSATAVAGLRAKTIDALGVSQSDKKSLLATNPELKMIEYPTNLLSFFYWRLDKPPFDDVRVRQAVSMGIDRDEFLKVLYEGSGTYNNAVPSGLESWWLDPSSKEMGDGAKYYKKDVAAAKKLLANAGYPNGLKAPMISTLNRYGNTFNQGAELIQKQLKAVGIEPDFRAQDYGAYIASTFLGKFDAPAIVWGLETQFNDPHDYLFNMYHPKGSRNHAGVNDPVLTEMIEKQMRALDKAERKKTIFDIQKYLAEKQYYVIQSIGNTAIFTQPWVRDYYPQADYGAAAEIYIKIWFENKPTN